MDNANNISDLNTNTIYIDKEAPTDINLNIIPDSTSLVVNYNADDISSGLDTMPYRISVDDKIVDESTNDGWKSGSSYTINNLNQNTEYNIKLEVRDKVGNIATKTSYAKTLLSGPTILLYNVSSNTADISINSNGVSFQTIVSDGTNDYYIDKFGALTKTISWNNSKIVNIIGLNNDTKYTIKVKGGDGEILSGFSNILSFKTLTQGIVYPKYSIRKGIYDMKQ